MNRFAHQHAKVKKIDAVTKPGRHGRRGSAAMLEEVVIGTSNACLREPVNGGAEKK
jgi:hypothetical protein